MKKKLGYIQMLILKYVNFLNEMKQDQDYNPSFILLFNHMMDDDP